MTDGTKTLRFTLQESVELLTLVRAIHDAQVLSKSLQPLSDLPRPNQILSEKLLLLLKHFPTQ